VRRPARSRADEFRAALVPWVLARVLVLAGLALARYLVSHTHPAAAGTAVRAHEGLLGWDAGFYRDIAAFGYARLPRQALRFFPLVPLLARALSYVTTLSRGASLLVVSNLAALVAGMLVYRLAGRETGDSDLARRAAWLLAVAPPAYVLVMGYSESTMLVFVLAAFLAARSRRWLWAAAFGYLAGLTRPLGVLLAGGLAVEALRAWRADRRRLAPALVATIAPLAGAATYMGWVAARFGSFWLPVTIQQQHNLRGHFANPVTTVLDDTRGLFHGHIGTGLHVPWLAVLVVLAVVAFRLWPASYALFGLLVLGLAASSANLDSLERYALSAFPFILTGAALTADQRVERSVLTLFGGALMAYSVLAFLNAVVP